MHRIALNKGPRENICVYGASRVVRRSALTQMIAMIIYKEKAFDVIQIIR